ncbi:MAG: hypothetical protein WAP51_04050 [Candidatus Sungiibacteriota bacterium]
MFNDFYNSFYDYFATYNWPYFLFWARIISGAIAIGLIAAIAAIVRKLAVYNRPLRHEKTSVEGAPVKRRRQQEPWLAILKKLESENPSDWNLAVMQADSIADNILKEMGLGGETMGERMKALDKSRLATLDDLWEAHRIRNEIAHSPEKSVTKHRAVYAVSLFEEVLKELGYLEE